MKRKLVIVLICCPLFLFAQQTVKVTKPMDNSSQTDNSDALNSNRTHSYKDLNLDFKNQQNNYQQKLNNHIMENSGRIEKYDVLKSNRKIRHGHYQQIINANILEDGYYKNGQKDSLWQSYNISGVLISSGKYKDDQQVGNWNFYDFNGVLEQTYDFTNQKLLYYLPDETDKEKKYSVLIHNESEKVILDRPALFVGGTGMVQNTLLLGVKIPREALETGKSGKVVIQLLINEKGEVIDYKIKKSYGYGLDEEVLRVVETLKHWLPAIYQGKEITSYVIIPYKLTIN